MPDNSFIEILLPFLLVISSIEIFMSTRWVILVKFPDALLGGISANWDAVFEPIKNNVPLQTILGNASIVYFAF